jgi:hypothetical protein
LITDVMGWLGGNAVVLGAFVLLEFARRATPEKHYANGTQRRPSPGSRQVEYVLQIAASAALFSSALNSTGKQITTSRLDPSNHLVEHVAAGHASTVPQTILNALLKHVLGI